MPQAFFSEDPPFNAYFPTPAPTQQAQVGLPFNAPWGGGSGAPIPTPTHPTQHPTLPPLPPSPDDDDDPEFQQKKERYFELMDASVTWARENPGQKVDKEVIQSVANEVFALIEYFRLQRDPGWNDKNLFEVKDGSLKFLTFLDIFPKGESQNFTLEYIRRFLQKERLSWHEFKQLVDSDDHSIHWHLGFGKVNNDLRNKFRGAINTMDGNEENQPPASNHSAHHPTGTHHPNGAHHHNVQRHNFAERAAAAAAAASRYNNKPTAQEPNIQYFPFRPPPVPEGGFNFADPTHPTNGETLDPLGSRLPYAFAAGGGGRGEEERNSTMNDRMSTDSLQGEDDIPEAAKLVFGNNVFVDQQQQQAPPEASTQATASTLDSVPAAPVPPPAPDLAQSAEKQERLKQQNQSQQEGQQNQGQSQGSFGQQQQQQQQQVPTVASPPAPGYASAPAPTKSEATLGAAPSPAATEASPGAPAPAPASEEVSTNFLRTPQSEMHHRTGGKLQRTRLWSNYSTSRHLNTPGGRFPITNQAALQTPQMNPQRMAAHIETATRGQVLFQTIAFDAKVESFGDNDGKLDAPTMLGFRRAFHPMLLYQSAKREMQRLFDLLDTNDMYAVHLSSQLSLMDNSTGSEKSNEELEAQVTIVKEEQVHFSKICDQLAETKNVVSSQTRQRVEKIDFDVIEDVQEHEHQIEELERQIEERKRLIVERKSEGEKQKENVLYNEQLEIGFANELENKLIQRNITVKEENARRLALPLAFRKCEKEGPELLRRAIELKNPFVQTNAKDKNDFEKQKADYMKFLTLIDENDDSLIQEAFYILYGE